MGCYKDSLILACPDTVYIWGPVDDRPPPALAQVLVQAPPPPPALPSVSVSPPTAGPPKRPDKSTKPKLPPRPLSKVFSSSDHGAAVLQVKELNVTLLPID